MEYKDVKKGTRVKNWDNKTGEIIRFPATMNYVTVKWDCGKITDVLLSNLELE